MALEFQELGSKSQDKWPEAIKLKQTALPRVRDRKLRDRHGALPGKTQKLYPGKGKNKNKLTNTRAQLVFYSLEK